MLRITPFDFTKDWSHYCTLHHQARGRAVDQAFIKWKYLDNPAGPALAYGAWDGPLDGVYPEQSEGLGGHTRGPLVGFAALVPQRFCVQGEEGIAGLGEDMAAPGQDREEIVVRLTEKLLEEMSARGWLWSYRVLDKKEAGVYVNRLGHTKAAEVPCWVKIRKWRLAKKWLGLGRKPKETAGFRMAYHSYKVRMVREFDRRFDELWERCRSEHPISVVKDAGYLKWRYLDHPTDKHQILTVEDQGKLKGFAVLRGGDLLELLCEVDTDAYKTLVKAAEKVWRSTDQAVSRAWVLGDRLAERALAGQGWREWKKGLRSFGLHPKQSLVVYPNSVQKKSALGIKAGNWRLTKGEEDYLPWNLY